MSRVRVTYASRVTRHVKPSFSSRRAFIPFEPSQASPFLPHDWQPQTRPPARRLPSQQPRATLSSPSRALTPHAPSRYSAPMTEPVKRRAGTTTDSRHAALNSLRTRLSYPASVPELLRELDRARRDGLECWEGHIDGSFGEREEVEKAIEDHCSPARRIEWEGWEKLVVTFALSKEHEVVASELVRLIDRALEKNGREVLSTGNARTFSPPGHKTSHALTQRLRTYQPVEVKKPAEPSSPMRRGNRPHGYPKVRLRTAPPSLLRWPSRKTWMRSDQRSRSCCWTSHLMYVNRRRWVETER